MAVEKPSGVAMYPKGVYQEHNLHTLLGLDVRWKNQTLRFAHRLDAETSGVVLIAKSQVVASALGKDFLAHRVLKRYHALVFGAPELSIGQIDDRLGMDRESGFRVYRKLDALHGQPATTRYRLLESSGQYSLLECEPITGRTHQIRAHLAFRGHPIVGDKMYIDINHFKKYVREGMTDDLLSCVKMKRLALHAHAITFLHPIYQEWMTVQSKTPDFRKELHA